MSDLINSMYPVGTIYLTVGTSATGSSSPAQWLGGTWEMLPEGYALWTNNTTVNDEREGDDTDSVKYRMKKPGLPNITGKISISAYGYYDKEGVFTDTSHAPSDANGAWGNGFNMRYNYIDFNASKSDSIYGNSNTVQPPSYKVYAWKRIA